MKRRIKMDERTARSLEELTEILISDLNDWQQLAVHHFLYVYTFGGSGGVISYGGRFNIVSEGEW